MGIIFPKMHHNPHYVSGSICMSYGTINFDIICILQNRIFDGIINTICVGQKCSGPKQLPCGTPDSIFGGTVTHSPTSSEIKLSASPYRNSVSQLTRIRKFPFSGLHQVKCVWINNGQFECRNLFYLLWTWMFLFFCPKMFLFQDVSGYGCGSMSSSNILEFNV